MNPTISIPQDWQFPRFGFGDRTELGTVIGMRYYAEDTYLGNKYGQGWHYVMLAGKHCEDEEHRTEDRIKLLPLGDLKTTLEAEIQNHQRQIQSLKHQLRSIPGSVIAVNSTVGIEPVITLPQSAISLPPLRNLVEGARFLVREIAKHPDYLALGYQPDLTIGDAETALSYLELELKSKQDSD